ncbi:FkbM family methyltransferase [Yersinia intermedia]|uniref:FkbM family methyltransferase n=1 Tax=Yersinia intermedia TaxID=631 RepID=UPI0011A9B220|nr:FkbM family methyltransferase [Yersinia intermedia]MDN0114733.1 FkbM family methyltransferase [Yersinia intermedia]
MKSSNIIIDIGANYGGFSLEIAKRNPNKVVYAIEAEPSLAKKLELEATEKQLKNHKVENFAISDTEGIADFFISELGDHGTSSLLRFSKENIINDEYWAGRQDLQHTKKTSVHTKRLDTFLDEIIFNDIDFIKIDIQGLDLVALKSAGKYLSKIKAGMLEMPAVCEKSLYENNYDDLRIALNYLYENSFIVYGIKPNDEASNEFNIFFYRNGENIERIENDLNIRNFLYYDGKNYWHAPSYKLENPEQNIINLNLTLDEEKEKNNELNEKLNNIKNSFFMKSLSKLGLFKNI